MSATEVLIIGAGPVGLSMGIECIRHGLEFRLVDKLPFLSGKSKALGIWSATQEVFSAMGVVEPILRASLHVKAGRLCRGKHTLLRMTPGDHVDTPYPDALVLPQCDTERILTTRLEELGGRVERGTEIVSFVQNQEGTNAVLKQSDGREQRVHCRFLVGCDGAHSTVRQLAGVTFSGESMGEIWVLFSGKKPTHRDAGLLESIRLATAEYTSVVRVLGVWAGAQPPQEEWFMDRDLAAHRRYGVDQTALYLIRPDGYVGARAQPATLPTMVGYLRNLRLSSHKRLPRHTIPL